MTEEKIGKFKKNLEETKTSLEEEINKLETPSDMGDFPGEEENMDESEQSFNQRSAAAALREEMDSVESALLKIEKGTYGKCEECGNEIEEEVLEISPDARMCKECNKKNIVKK